MKTLVVNAPANYQEIMNGWQFAQPATADLDFVRFSVKTQHELHTQLPKLKVRLKLTGMIWVSWLKKAVAYHQM